MWTDNVAFIRVGQGRNYFFVDQIRNVNIGIFQYISISIKNKHLKKEEEMKERPFNNLMSVDVG